MVRDIEAIGAQVHATAGREQMIYSAMALKPNAKDLVEMLAETTLEGNFVEWELAEKKAFYANDIADLVENPQLLLTEKAHTAGYSGGGLGMPLMCSAKGLGQLTPDVLGGFMEAHYTPANMVLAAAGVEHAELVKAAEAAFGSVPKGSAPAPAPKSTYSGGEYRAVAETGLTHVGCVFLASPCPAAPPRAAHAPSPSGPHPNLRARPGSTPPVRAASAWRASGGTTRTSSRCACSTCSWAAGLPSPRVVRVRARRRDRSLRASRGRPRSVRRQRAAAARPCPHRWLMRAPCAPLRDVRAQARACSRASTSTC